MILTDDLKEAFGTMEVSEMDLLKNGPLRTELKSIISEYGVRVGQANLKETFVDLTVEVLAGDLKKYYTRLRIGEAVLAIRLAALGKFGDPKHVSAENFKNAIDLYLHSRERRDFKEKVAKEENEAKNAKLLSQKTEWTEDEYVEKMRERYIENLNRVAAGKTTLDIGGLLFEHLVKNEIIELTEHDIAAAEELLNERRKANPFDHLVRTTLERHRTGEPVLIPMAREMVLTKYFKMEVEMRLMEKANELKQKAI